MSSENAEIYKIALENAEIFACSYAEVFSHAHQYAIIRKLFHTMEKQLTGKEYEDFKQTIIAKIKAEERS